MSILTDVFQGARSAALDSPERVAPLTSTEVPDAVDYHVLNILKLFCWSVHSPSGLTEDRRIRCPVELIDQWSNLVDARLRQLGLSEIVSYKTYLKGNEDGSTPAVRCTIKFQLSTPDGHTDDT